MHLDVMLTIQYTKEKYGMQLNNSTPPHPESLSIYPPETHHVITGVYFKTQKQYMHLTNYMLQRLDYELNDSQ